MKSRADRDDRRRSHRRWWWSVGPVPLLLDTRTDVAAAYSLRQVRTAYTGPLVRLRRSSDNAELDFGTGQAWLNFSDVSGWAGGTAFATTFYDQSGNVRHLLQSTAASQPQIIQAANGRPALLFDGVSQMMQTAAFTLNQAWSFNLCYRRVTTVQAAFENIIDGSTADSGTLFNRIGTPGQNTMYAGSFGPQSDNGISMATGVRGVVACCFNAAASLLEVNATTIAGFTGNPGAGNPGGLTIGCRADGNAARFTNLEAQEWAVFNTAHTSTQLKADNAAIRAAWGF